jgi:hypothetical protein
MGTGEYKVVRCELDISQTGVQLRKDGGTPRPGKLRFNPRELETATLLFLVELLRAYRLRGDEANLVGEWLYRLLLENSFGDELHAALSDKNTFLRIELVFDDPNGDLAKLPWEYLRRPASTKEEGYFLAAHEQAALVRRPMVDCRPLRIGGEQEPPKILFVASSPSDLPPLVFTAVRKEMQQLGKPLDKVKVMALASPFVKDPTQQVAKRTKPKATYDEFKEALKSFGPHVVHFLGHGRFNKDNGRGEIAFMDENYKARWISGDELKGDLKKCESVRLAFLQACESATEDTGQGARPAVWSDAYQALSSVAGSVVQIGIPAIVAMQAKVENMSANNFARAFYQALVAGTPIYRAVQIARVASPEGAPPANEQVSCVPVLYLDTSGVNDEGILFGAPASSAVTNVPAPPPRKLPDRIQCPWSPCGKVIMVSPMATEPPQYCSKCRNALFCPQCGEAVSNVDTEDREYSCTKCTKVISRVPPPAAAAQRLQPAAAPLSLGG